MKPSHARWLKRLPALFEIPAPDPPRLLHRIELMERNILLPVKAVFIGIILYSFQYSTMWVAQPSSMLAIVVQTVQFISWGYILLSLLLALPLLNVWRLPMAVVQWTVVTISLADGIEVAALALISGGQDSILFWLFVVLIIRNAVSLPPGFSQLVLNFFISLCYVLVCGMEIIISDHLEPATLHALESLDLTPHEELGEPFVMRLAVLWLTTFCCYGAQVLSERARLAAEEAAEFAARESQLRSAGRLAAEFAHQIKNPLAVINTTTFSLQRAIRENKNSAAQQIEIIQEEVARADKVITQIMGYAQLSEGRVERLDVIEELDRAITQVFPPAVPVEIRIHRNYQHHFSPLLMQRGHLSEILVNLLQNAREALGERGNIFVVAAPHHDHAIEISVQDNGPGVAPDKIERIFEAYFTTKEKGTGLGLAIVKHNVELYGGAVRVESELGKGARFVLLFPAKALMKINLK